jgi:hypothetical protein
MKASPGRDRRLSSTSEDTRTPGNAEVSSMIPANSSASQGAAAASVILPDG